MEFDLPYPWLLTCGSNWSVALGRIPRARSEGYTTNQAQHSRLSLAQLAHYKEKGPVGLITDITVVINLSATLCSRIRSRSHTKGRFTGHVTLLPHIQFIVVK